jgi:hypothetical protein
MSPVFQQSNQAPGDKQKKALCYLGHRPRCVCHVSADPHSNGTSRKYFAACPMSDENVIPQDSRMMTRLMSKKVLLRFRIHYLPFGGAG